MKILVVDDDPRLREIVRIALEGAQFDVVTASDGSQALIHANREAPDLIVLDVGLPKADGFEICRKVRSTSDVPILFLTAHDDEVDRILGLELGADDYVTKPFSPRELVARIKAILKRSGHGAPARDALTRGNLRLDVAAHACSVGSTQVPLTATEFQLLHRLMRMPGRIHTRDQIIEELWGDGDVADRTLDSHLRNLRKKLSAAGCASAVDTVHGVGIRLGACAAL